MLHSTKGKQLRLLAVLPATALLAAACNSAGGDGTGGTDGSVTLSFANSYTSNHPHTRCGIERVAEKVAEKDVGVEIETFPDSQLGADDERFSSVMSGDVDMDVQGSSALASTYAPIGVFDMAYAIDGPDHLFDVVDGGAADEVFESFQRETGARVLDTWYFGMRHFSANAPIRTPDDLEGLRLRFPDSPIYLSNAEAMGADATPVAFEEVYVSLQQGVIDGQENPIPTIAEKSFDEVQSHVSMSGHQTGSQMIVISEDRWQELSGEQQDALATAVHETRQENRQCIEEDEDEIVQEWEQGGDVEIVDDVDREAFREKTEEYFLDNLDGEQLEFYKKTREATS
ncbi:DctP family TRAP transporter solute-binding subunit [Haloechinothrix sp. YIM 98757]|uniref:DctP family TRAP transporter solute-binding subunit n=1 Tax=Haloechinothrix aidingensis TaxID=2752311 RepID=A0A838A6U8_9PSEU|nr:DctP family TRAP transporter solute-binding subunit [Haloechinothrix aidingensis]MBA0124868.1 DctP family TRAP transporter solute-binding subunit [Haloechinothrix aidingensis]